MTESNAFAGEIYGGTEENFGRPRPKCTRRALPLEVTPHRYFWYGPDVKRTRPEIEDVEILR